MAYGIKYIMQFTSDRGNETRIEVLKKDYQGEIVYKSLGGAPSLSIEQGDGAIKGSSLAFAMQADVEGELQELYTTDNKLFKVNLYKNDTLRWQGFMLPELYSENYVDAPYDVSVTATDGLATLKAVTYIGNDVNASIANIISNIVARTEISMPIVYHMQLAHNFKKNIGEDIELSPGIGLPIPMLTDTYINQAAYNGYSCYDVLNQILQSCNCNIMQINGEWLVSSNTDYSESYYVAEDFTARSHKVIGQMGIADVYPLGTLSMVNVPALKGATVEYSHMLRNSFLQNANCESRKGWNYTPDSRIPIDIPGEREMFGKIFKAYCWELHPNNIQENNSLQLWQDVQLSQDAGNVYTLSVKTLFSTNAKLFLLSVTHIGNDGVDRQLTGEGWVTQWNKSDVNSYIQITGQAKGAGFETICNIKEYDVTSVQFYLPDVGGSLRVGFINSTLNYANPFAHAPIYVTQVYLSVGNVTGQQSVTLVEPNATQEQQNVLIVYGDTFGSQNAHKLETNTLKNFAGENIGTWWLNGISYTSYYNMMLQEYSRYFGVKKMQLQGVLMGDNVLHNIYQDTHSGKPLRLLTAHVDLLTEEASVTLEEIVNKNVDYEATIEAAFNNNQFGQTSGSGNNSSGGGSGTPGGGDPGSAEITAQSIVDALGYVPYDSRNPSKYITESALKSYATNDDITSVNLSIEKLSRAVENRVLASEFDVFKETVNPLFGYFDASGSANNALKLGGHSADYFATADALNTHIKAFNTYKTTTNDRLDDLEALWYMDDEGNVHTTHNIVVDGGGAFGKGSGGGGDVPSGGGIDETQLWNILGTSGTQTIHSSHIPDLSNKYLSASGGTISGNLTVDGNFGLTGYINTRSHYLFVRNNDNADWVVTNKNWSAEYTIIHSGNYTDYAYPKDGKGYMSIGSNGRPVMVNNQGYGAKNASGTTEEILWLGPDNITYVGGTTSKKVFLYDYSPACLSGTFLHTGNYTDYALPLSGGELSGNLTVKSERGNLILGETVSWQGAKYPTIFSSAEDRYVMIPFPHIQRYEKTEGETAAQIRFEGDNLDFWDIWVDKEFQLRYNKNGYNVFSFAKDGTIIQSCINDWLMPANIQIGRKNSDAFADRACIGVTDGNLHIDAYKGKNIYLNYYSTTGKVFFNNESAYILGSYFNGTAESATKLQTARTIWGQSFDGSGDVSGALFGATYIRANEASVNGIYLKASSYTSVLGESDIAIVTPKLAILDGNVLIGTTDDSGQKLKVAGPIVADLGNTGGVLIGGNGNSIDGYVNGALTELHLNYTSPSNISLCRGGGKVLIGTPTNGIGKVQISHNDTYPLMLNGSTKYSVIRFEARGVGVADIGWFNEARGNLAYVANTSSVGIISVDNSGVYYTDDSSIFKKYRISTLNTDNSLSVKPTGVGRYYNIGTLDASWAGLKYYGLIWSSANTSNTGDIYTVIAMPHIPYLEKNKRGYTGETYGSIIRFESDIADTAVWDIGTKNDTFSIVRGGKYWFNIFNNNNGAFAGTTKIPESSWKGTLVVGTDSYNKAVIGYCTSSTNGVVFGGHNSILNAWAPVNISGSVVYLRYNEVIKGTIHSSGFDVTGNLTVTGGGAFGSDIRYKDITSYRQLDLETIVNAPLFTFKWNDREDRVEHLGTSAQYWLDTQFKDAVNTANKDFYHLDYGALAVGIGISVAREVKGVKTEVQLLREKVNQLEQELAQYRRS